MLTPVARRRTAAVSLVLLAPLLSACGGIGFGYQTDQVYQPGVGVNDRSGTVDVLGAVIVASGEGEGTLVTSLVNQDKTKDDALVAVSGDAESQVLAPVEISPDSLVNLADTGAVSVTGDRVQAGNFVRLTLEFQSGQKTVVNVPVVPDEDEYSDIEEARPSAKPTS